MEKPLLTIAKLNGFYADVKAFWIQFDLPWRRSIDDLGLTGCNLSANCIQEELKEFIEAETYEDKLDGMVDLLYVSIGAMLAAGLSDKEFIYVNLVRRPDFVTLAQKVVTAFNKRPLPCTASIKMYTPELVVAIATYGTATWPMFEQAWDTVQMNNMGKMWTNQQVAELDPTILVKTKHVGVDNCIVWRASDGKLMKPPGYAKPNLTPFIN